MMLIDSHCHLSCGQFDKDRKEVAARAAQAGVRALIEIGTTPGNWHNALSLACDGMHVFCAIGLHPHYVKNAHAKWEEDLAAIVRENQGRIVAIGEAGLDFYRDLSPREEQKAAFMAQLQMAADFSLPFVMHARNADAEVLEILGAWKARLGRPLDGVWHCFSSGPKEAMAAIELGLHLGFGGVMTYHKSDSVREAARVAPASRLLLETDAPYVTPQAMRDKNRRNEPAFVSGVAKVMAQVRGTTMEDVATTTTQNAKHLFGITI